MQLAVLIVMLAAFLAYPVGALVRRLRGRRHAVPSAGRAAARFLAVLGPAAVLGGVGYLGYLSATGTQAVGPVLGGRPVAWLIVQLLAVGAVIAAAATAAACWRNRRQMDNRATLGLVLAGAVVFLPWAAYWGLLMP